MQQSTGSCKMLQTIEQKYYRHIVNTYEQLGNVNRYPVPHILPLNCPIHLQTVRNFVHLLGGSEYFTHSVL